MALIMTRECGLGPLLNNYIRVMGISVRTNETYGSFIDILVKCYLSKESRDFEKMKQYIIDNNLIPIATNTAQADYLNLYWNKPNVLSVGEMSISGPVDLKDYAKKTQSQILAIAYGAIIEKKSAFGFKNRKL